MGWGKKTNISAGGEKKPIKNKIDFYSCQIKPITMARENHGLSGENTKTRTHNSDIILCQTWPTLSYLLPPSLACQMSNVPALITATSNICSHPDPGRAGLYLTAAPQSDWSVSSLLRKKNRLLPVRTINPGIRKKELNKLKKINKNKPQAVACGILMYCPANPDLFN